MYNLQEYFPSNYALINYAKSTGVNNARYTFQRDPKNGLDGVYNSFMNLNKPGVPYMWRKEYFKNNVWCTETYAILFFGTDGSVTETGDWYAGSPCTPNVVLGYKTFAGANTGLIWCPVGGLTTNAVISEMDVWRQNTPGAPYTNSTTDAYGKVGLIEHFDNYTVPYGRDLDGNWGEGFGSTYEDVIHIVMYHGTRALTPNPVRCVGPISAEGAYYQSYKDYNSYAIELWLAKGVGIIQENCPFIEDASPWGMANCTGNIFYYPGAWLNYIDEGV